MLRSSSLNPFPKLDPENTRFVAADNAGPAACPAL